MDKKVVEAEIVTAEKKSPNKNIAIYLAAAALVLSATSLGFVVVDYFNGDTPITFNSGSGVDGNSANFVEGSISDIANKVSPAVVSITTETRTTSFWGQDSTSTAAGTGMIVTADGYVLTNKHVVSGANKVKVILDDGTVYNDVTIVGVDPLNDVAFLKINGVSELPTVTLGDSKTITNGQQVITIGNALGQYQNSVASGIISGTGRSIVASDGYYQTEQLTDMIQTDAAINAGNSGGPLVNAAGQVIGINTATSSDAENIGFAIPISSVKGMLNYIIRNGKADRAYIGIYYTGITADIAKEMELPVSTGAYVYSQNKYSAVISGGPADKAGIKEKDIILSINGTKIGAAGSVTSLVGEYMPGDTVQLGILRNGKEMAINVTLGSYSEFSADKS